MKRKELFWMLVPCLILLGAAWYFSRREVQQSGPWQLVVTKTEKVPILPREVAEGFDTKWEITLEERGQRPEQLPLKSAIFVNSVSIHRKTDGIKMAVNCAAEMNSNRINGKLVPQYLAPITFLTSLAGVPKAAGALVLRADIRGYEGRKRNGSYQLPLPPIDVEVRAENQAVQIPAVSRRCPLSMVSTTVTKGGPWNSATPAIPGNTWIIKAKVKFHGSIIEKRNKAKFRGWDSYLTDERGHKIKLSAHRYFRGEGTWSYHPVAGGVKDDQYWFEFTFADRLLPAHAKKITFSSFVSANDAWPLEITAVIPLNKDSKAPKTVNSNTLS